jgi:uncharacterized BrkB/YihY/UPF0761 family membrane protein
LGYAWLPELAPVRAAVSDASGGSVRAETRAVLLFANAQLLDMLTTVLGLRSGLLSEANPLAGSLLDRSMQWTLTLKLLIGFAVLLLVYRFVSRRNRTRTLRLMAGIALLAALANALQLLFAS